MARENQGLQIALIVFTMLTVVLGATTYLGFHLYSQSETRLKAAQDDSRKSSGELNKEREVTTELKKMLGVQESDSLETVQNRFKEDIASFGKGYPADSLFYRPLIAKLYRSLQDQYAAAKAKQDELAKAQANLKARESSKDSQMKELRDSAKKAGDELASQTQRFTDDRKRISDDQSELKEQLQTAKKEVATTTAKLEEKVQSVTSELQKTRQVAKKKAEQINALTSSIVDSPDGEIRWVNQREQIVWLNLGRADGLNPLMSFAVYPTDITDLAKGTKKADIEVTQILGDHMAEARITSDTPKDPIMPGDKIHTPLWSPGDQRHFSIAGVVDMDGDGKSDLGDLRNLITMNGGVVDSELDDQGNLKGEMSYKTRFLVMGEQPDAKTSAKMLAGYSKMIDQADSLGIQKISLADLMQRMGFKPQSRVVNFGSGGNPKDFAPKSEKETQRVSSGSVSDIFKKRTPPTANSGGAY